MTMAKITLPESQLSKAYGSDGMLAGYYYPTPDGRLFISLTTIRMLAEALVVTRGPDGHYLAANPRADEVADALTAIRDR